MNHRPRKRFGQNFLQDQAIIEQIISSLHLRKDDTVIEIGPGRGALTAPLLSRLNALTAIEIDRDLHTLLKATLIEGDKLDLISADALSVDYSQFGNDLRLVGNLPYNISTPLLLHLLRYQSSITDLHFMLQKEVVDRLAAEPCTKDYGRLSVMIQYHCAVTHLFDVPATAFYPVPKVSSAIVRLKPYKESPFPAVNIKDLEMVVGKAFGMRRKTLANNLKGLLDAHALEALNIDPRQRPEQIPVEDFVKMALVIKTKAP